MSSRSKAASCASNHYHGPSPATGPEYATHDGLEAFAATHASVYNTQFEAFSNEPTKTIGLRKEYAKRLRGALERIRAAAREGIVERDVLALEAEALADAPPAFDFPRNSEKEEAFRGWLDEQLEEEILVEYGGENSYIASSYERALRDANEELRQEGIADPSPVETSLRLPVHEQQLEELYTRNFRALEGLTESIGQDISRELSDGLATGEGPRDVAGRVSEVLGKVEDGTNRGAMARATTIARTELLNSHHRATLTQWSEFGVQQVGILLAPDACSLCEELKSGEPYTLQEVHSLLPRHPNCRCSPTIYTGS